MLTERFDYIYCLNPRCSNPQNLKEMQDCQTCGFPLNFQGRIHNYKAIIPLNQRQRGRLREIEDTSSYQGVDQQGRQYLLKVFNGNDAKISDLFKKEKEILMTLHHPNIPKLIDEFEYRVNRDSFFCLVIEKIEGCNLEEWLEKHHKLSQETALIWMSQIVETLDYVHKNQFLHQDIKPSNIILNSSENRLYLVDFSQIPDLVSPGYTPPEQANNSALPASDFYAMGMTFIHLLTGKHPGAGQSCRTGKLLDKSPN